MDKHFIKDIEIVQFKCFHNFSSSGFNRVNLISGKNNVGKTAFMEAVYVNVSAEDVATFSTAISSIKFMRENINILFNDSLNNNTLLMEAIRQYQSLSNIRKTKFEILLGEGKKEYIFHIEDKTNLVLSNEFVFTLKFIKNINFLDNFGNSYTQIINDYASVQKNDKEEYLNSVLNRFDSRIESFKVIESKPQCKVNGEYIELTEFGDGLRHLISIVCAVFASENGYLFIDEIDNGIHYTQLSEIWKVIFEVSQELNCQVFATTHSKEMINSFVDTAKSQEFQDISFIEFGLKEGEIRSLVYDYKNLLSERSQNHEIRGW